MPAEELAARNQLIGASNVFAAVILLSFVVIAVKVTANLETPLEGLLIVVARSTLGGILPWVKRRSWVDAGICSAVRMLGQYGLQLRHVVWVGNARKRWHEWTLPVLPRNTSLPRFLAQRNARLSPEGPRLATVPTARPGISRRSWSIGRCMAWHNGRGSAL